MEYKFVKNVAHSEKTRGLWNVYEGENGESSLTTEIIPKVIWESCPPEVCYFELVSPSSREVVCRKCQKQTTFILGMQKLIDGKLVKML